MDHPGPKMGRYQNGFFSQIQISCLAPYVGPARLKSSQNTRANRSEAIDCKPWSQVNSGPDDSWTGATICSHDDDRQLVALSRASRGRPAAPTRGSAISGPRRDGRRLSSVSRCYDFTSRTWRLGAPLPEAKSGLCGVVCDAKLFLIRSNANNMYVYDPKFDTWTLEINVPSEFWYSPVRDVCNHKGRVVVFLQSGTTSVRLAPGHWYLVDLCQDANEIVHDNHNGNRYAAESVLLG